MPLYEYECAKCGHKTEVLRLLSQKDQAQDCEKCGSKKTRRAHSVFAAAVKQTVPAGPSCGSCAERGSCPMA